MTKAQLKRVSSLFAHYGRKIRITKFSKLNSPVMFKNKRHPSIFISYRVPVARLEKYCCNCIHEVIGPNGALKKYDIERMVNIPFDYNRGGANESI